VAHSARHTEFLAQRLRGLGLEIEHDPKRSSALGELPLEPTPFETLKGSLRPERARFYTLGHSRVKFFQPPPFFQLPAMDVSRCESSAEIESALRRAWAIHLKELRSARAWLEGLGVEPLVAGRGTLLGLPLAGVEGPPAQVQSRTSIHLPSSGPLSHVSLNSPGERTLRPRPNLEHSSDLELDLCNAMERIARRCTDARKTPSPPPRPAATRSSRVRRVLVVDRDRSILTAAESLLRPKGFSIDTFQAPERALAAFREHSYDLVLASARMPRGDGLEFTALVRELPGVENLPIVLMDERVSDHHKREAIAAGAAGFFRKPLEWSEINARLTDLLEHTNLRRFERYTVRLPVEPTHGTDGVIELTDQIARGGFGLRSNRELPPDTVEQYRITLPGALGTVALEGQVIYQQATPEDAAVHSGVRVLRFLDEHESEWIRLIEELVRAMSGKRELPEL